MPGLGGREDTPYYRLLMSCRLPGPSEQTCLCHSLGRSQAPHASTWKTRGLVSLGLSPRFGIGAPANPTQGRTVRSMNKRTRNYERIISTKIAVVETSSSPKTHSFPFTWVLLMDLGLGSADNINGSRLTEVPLQ